MVCSVGTKFIVWPVMTSKTEMANRPFRERAIKSILFGDMIGFICGFVGVGGGAMMLIVLTAALGFELKTAIGTSVFIMSFTALFGAVSHVALGAKPDLLALAICIVFTFVAAQVSAVFANKSSLERLNKAVGICLWTVSYTHLGAMAAITPFSINISWDPSYFLAGSTRFP